ncbi:hypothetical protein ECE50_000705 [Chitinophaga sp. Mgbs1]|uniref:YD repeat-containing protein n=1 Tax=Chitinophaga solisilvae TaxID=1233460 RepID=A0A9Q5D311_9BACT|nr:hypothetical protein [Chitinophaga solisilvae]
MLIHQAFNRIYYCLSNLKAHLLTLPCLLFSSLLLTARISHAQDDASSKNMLKKLVPITPEAASLGKYDAVPVSLYTGIPNISIPIYEIDLNGFKLPISLSYHAGGIKIEDIASCVGQGWTLNAGGVINRMQRGGPDELMVDRYSQYKSDIEQMNNPALDTVTRNKIVTKWGASGGIDQGYDTESDIFSFNFNGQIGKFFHDPDGTVFMMPVKNRFVVKHEGVFYITVNRRYRWARWIITDDTGVRYVFGRSLDGLNDNLEQTCNQGFNIFCDDNTSVNSWFLSEILLQDGRKITFNYDVSSYSNNNTGVYTTFFPNTCAVFGGPTNINTTTEYKRALRLREIIFPGGKVSFVPGQNRVDLPGEKYIDKIDIYSSTSNGSSTISTLRKSFKLTYNNSQRLRLMAIGEIDINSGQITKSHTFDYNPMSLPSRFSKSQDLWGYYNGQNNTTLAPEVYYSSNGSSIYSPGANRAVDPEYTKAEVLTTITYPTGGKSIFEYENNTFRCGVPEQVQTLCDVISMTSKFPVKEKLINFKSENMGYSSYFTYSNDIVLKPVAGSRLTRSVRFSGRYLPYDDKTCTKLDMTGGGSKYLCVEADLERKNPDQTYSKVIGGITFGINFELEPSLGDTFRLVVKWWNPYNGLFYLDTYYKYEDIPAQLDVLKGEKLGGGLRIKRLISYDPVSGDSLIKKYEYKFDEKDDPAMNGTTTGVLMNGPVIFFKQPYCNQEGGYICGGAMGVTSRPTANVLSGDGINVGYQKVTEYSRLGSQNGKSVTYFTTAMDYTDDNLFNSSGYPFPEPRSQEWRRGLEIRKEEYKSAGSEIKLIQRDSSSYLFNSAAENYKEHNAIKIIQYPSIFLSSLGNICLYSFDYTRYKIGTESFYLQKNISKYYPDKVSSLESIVSYKQNSQSLQVAYEEKITSQGERVTVETTYPSDYDTTVIILSTEASGIKKLLSNHIITIPVEKITIRKDLTGKEYVTDGIINVFYPDRPLVSKIYLLNQQNIPVSEFVKSKIGANGNFIMDSRYEERFLFNQYDSSFNLLEQQKKNDVKECYLWGYNNKYPVARIVGTDYNTAIEFVTPSVLQNPASDQELRNEINKLRLKLPQALVTSYSYIPLIGVSSITGPDNRTAYYEYDGLGRLSLIKDKDGKIVKQLSYSYQAPAAQ